MPETTAPQSLQASFLCDDAVFNACNVFLAKAQFFCNSSDEMADIYACVRGEKPQIVEARGLFACAVLASHNLFGGDFIEAIHGDRAIFRHVLKLWIGA